MTDNRDVKTKPSESEKITINLGFVDLGNVDLLVREGFYSNRSDFIRTAIRNQLERHQDAIQKTVARQQFDMGLRRFGCAELEAARAAGEQLNLHVLGLLVIEPEVPAELAAQTIASIRVLGALQASPAVKTALRGRIH